MLQRTIRRLAIAAALLSLLSLTPPVHAAGWGQGLARGDFFAGAMQWVAGFLGRSADMEKTPRRVKSDHGVGIDPDGTPGATTTSPICHGNCDGGMQIDPNG
jgi:hypothetical protein